MSLIYQEYQPSCFLSRYVSRYWTLHKTTDLNPDEHRVLPDGCLDLLFDNSIDVQSSIVGNMTKASLVPISGDRRFFGVRFCPGGAYPFFDFSLNEITDRRINLGDVWQDDSQTAELLQLKNTKSQILLVEENLRQRLRLDRVPNIKVEIAVSILTKKAGNYSIDNLSRAVNTSRQHLTRLFAEQVGITPKLFARITRLRAVIKRARIAQTLDWANIALDGGYYDQAHLISDFRELTGASPARFLKK